MDCLARSKFEYLVTEDQKFSFLFISFSWDRSLYQNLSHTNFEYLVSMGRSFLLSSFSVAGVAVFTEIRHTQLLIILSQMVRALIINLFPVAGVVFEVFMVK